MSDLSELRTLADNATPGEWSHSDFAIIADGIAVICENVEEYDGWSADAAFIAATNPEVVLGLLDRLEAARKLLNRVLLFGTESGQLDLEIRAFLASFEGQKE